MPLAYRLLPKVFWLSEIFTPKKANDFIVKMFLTPMKFKIPQAEITFKLTAEHDSFIFQNEELLTYRWGNPEGKIIFFMHGWSGRATQFRYFIEPLVQLGYQVLAIEGPGHTHSSKKKTNVLEFAECLSAFLKGKEVYAAIGHSLGGIALLYAMAHFQFKPKKLITIATPTIANEVIDIYREKIGASKKAYRAIDDYVINKTGNPFLYYSGLEIAKRLSPSQYPTCHLIVHDENDKEAPINHALELNKVIPISELYTSQNLGHVRILKDKTVVKRVLNFIDLNTEEVVKNK